jgi:SAM-dependent methyltransferase
VATEDRTIETYNKSARALAEYFRGIGPRKNDIQRAFNMVNRPQPNVVEIGCGNGRDAQEILAITPNYIGMDISAGMLRLARELNPKANFITGDLANFVAPADTDIIFSFASFLHSPKEDVTTFFENNYDSLNPDGIIYISTKEKDAYSTEVQKDQFGERLFYYYTPELVEELAGGKYKNEYLSRQRISSTDWFTMVLRKQ